MFKRIYIEITNICNLNCTFCKGTKREKQHMSIESFEKILKKIQGYSEYIYLHVLGEPLIHPDLESILNLSNKYNMKVNITTNGRFLGDRLDVINNAKCIRQINISLHSYNNVSDINRLLEVIDRITNDCYISLRLWNLGKSNNNNKIINLINNHYQLDVKINNNSYKIKDKLFIDMEPEFKWPDINNKICNTSGTCHGLRQQIGILVDGTVVPCCLDSDGIINLGNIFKDKMEGIINSSRFKAIKQGFFNNKLTEELCMKCEFAGKFNKQKKNKKNEKNFAFFI